MVARRRVLLPAGNAVNHVNARARHRARSRDVLVAESRCEESVGTWARGRLVARS